MSSLSISDGIVNSEEELNEYQDEDIPAAKKIKEEVNNDVTFNHLNTEENSENSLEEEQIMGLESKCDVVFKVEDESNTILIKEEPLDQEHSNESDNDDDDPLENGQEAQSQTEQRLKRARVARRLTSQTRKIIMNVYHYFRSQNELESEVDVQQKTAAATGICVRTLYRIRNQAARGRIESPPPRVRVAPLMDNLDSFAKENIRREILSFYERGDMPTISKLLARVKEPPVCFRGSFSSLRYVIRDLRFQYKKVQGGKHLLVEDTDVVEARDKYLRDIEGSRKSTSPRAIIYIAEAALNVSECLTRADDAGGAKGRNRKAETFLALLAGGEAGFIPGAALLATGRKGQELVASDRFCPWLRERLLPNIPANSVIVMENSYDSRVPEVPSEKSKKWEISRWLSLNNVPYDKLATKAELLHAVASAKDQEKERVEKDLQQIDLMASGKGHTVLRLPPCHCQLNPMELVWAKVMSSLRNDTMDNGKLSRVEDLVSKAANEVSREDWEVCVAQAKALEEEYTRTTRAVEHVVDNLLKTWDAASSDSDESWDDI